MENRAPWFKFCPRDWLSSSSVRRMTLQERGAYFDLLCHSWMDAGIPDDDQEIARLLQVNVRTWRKLGPRVRAMFAISCDGKLQNARQENERDKMKLWQEKSARGGLRSRKQTTTKAEPNEANGYDLVTTKREPNGNQKVRIARARDTDTHKKKGSISTPLPPNGISQDHESIGEGLDQSFARFWAVYPNKTRRGDAEHAWVTIDPNAELVTEILAAVARQRTGESWSSNGGAYIPQPVNWLRGQRWTDQPPEVLTTGEEVDF